MRRPNVTAENFANVDAFYRQYDPSVLATRIGYAAVNQIFRPHVQFEPEAESQIHDLLEDDELSIVLASNHCSGKDPCLLAGATSQSETLHPMVGHTSVLAKASLFKPGLRYMIDVMGGVPTFRKKDGGNTRTTLSVVETSIQLLERGRHLALFPEGTNHPEGMKHTEDPTTLMDMMPGIGSIIIKAGGRGRRTAIVPIGISYYPGSARHGEVVFGSPITDEFQKPKDVVDATRDGMQHVLDLASIATGRR